MKRARAIAHSNIALVKYWGKRDVVPDVRPDLNLPATGSLSLTLDTLRTETIVSPAEGDQDSFALNGARAPTDRTQRVIRHLERVFELGGGRGARPRCHVHSVNFLPTAAGLASSASGFAALTLAAAAAFELDLDRSRLSALARMGSGSAARSLWGGFVRLDPGERPDGSDCRARPLFPPEHWDLRMLVVQTARGEKKVGSSEGMDRSRRTSPYYPAWVGSSPTDLDTAERAVGDRDLAALGEVMEHSTLKMHACMMASRPPILYWSAATVAVLQAVWDARQNGLEAYVTMDAGPHVKVLCRPETATALASRLTELPGVEAAEPLAPGPDARVEVMS